MFARDVKKLEQPKYLSPVLSRTSLGKLPDAVRLHSTFRQDVLIASELAGGRLMFPHLGHVPELAKLTVGDWLDQLIAGQDPIKWSQNVRPERWDAPLVGLPRKPDRPESPDAAVGHVFEFRSVGDYMISDWPGIAERCIDVMMEVNNEWDAVVETRIESALREANL